MREVDVEEDVGAFDGATRIWADASILEKRPELVTRLAEATPETMVPLFVPLSEEQSLPGRGSSFIGPNGASICSHGGLVDDGLAAQSSTFACRSSLIV